MKPVNHDDPLRNLRAAVAKLPWNMIAGPLVAAEYAVARLDERLRASPVREGWIARSHFLDVVA